MIRKLTGLFTKLIDKSEEIIIREDEVLDELFEIDDPNNFLSVSESDLIYRETAPRAKYDMGFRWGEASWGAPL